MSSLDDLHIELRPDRERVFVGLAGGLDAANADQVQATVDELLGRGWREIVADLRDVDALDEAGVEALVAALRRTARTGGRFAVVAPEDGPADRALERSGAPLGRVDAISVPG